MEPHVNKHLEPPSSAAPSWRRRAVYTLGAVAIVLAVIWGETWAIERSADFIAVTLPAQPADADSTPGSDCATNAIPIATLH